MARRFHPAEPSIAAVYVLLVLLLGLLLDIDAAEAQTSVAAATIDTVTVGDGSLTIEWSAPAGVTGITAYDLRYIETSADETVDANWTEIDDIWTGSGDLEYRLEAVDNLVGYDVQVRAVNADGDGLWSDTETGTPTTDKAPTIYSATPGDRSITIAWTAPTNATLGTVTSYDLRYIRSDAANKADANWTGSRRSGASGSLEYTLNPTATPLVNDVAYDVQMRAVVGTDEHPWSGVRSATPRTPPGPATFVAVYSTTGQELEVRWSSSDYAATTGFRVQWKSGTDEYDSTDRQDLADPATSAVTASSSATSRRYKHTITGLTNGTEYTVRIIATNAGVDSSPSPEATGTPQSTPGQPQAFIENEVIKIHESDVVPWLRQTWDYVTAQSVEVKFQAQVDSTVLIPCNPFPRLDPCTASQVSIGRGSPALITDITHELGHVYSLSNNVTTMPGSLGVAHIYFWKLGLQGDDCAHVELYADILMFLVHGDHARNLDGYWYRCVGPNDKLVEEALAVVRSAVAGEMPSWLAATYSHAGGGLDLEGLWADVKTLQRPAVVYQLRNMFGGYCDNQKAAESVSGNGLPKPQPKQGVALLPGGLTALGSGVSQYEGLPDSLFVSLGVVLGQIGTSRSIGVPWKWIEQVIKKHLVFWSFVLLIAVIGVLVYIIGMLVFVYNG